METRSLVDLRRALVTLGSINKRKIMPPKVRVRVTEMITTHPSLRRKNFPLPVTAVCTSPSLPVDAGSCLWRFLNYWHKNNFPPLGINIFPLFAVRRSNPWWFCKTSSAKKSSWFCKSKVILVSCWISVISCSESCTGGQRSLSTQVPVQPGGGVWPSYVQ